METPQHEIETPSSNDLQKVKRSIEQESFKQIAPTINNLIE